MFSRRTAWPLADDLPLVAGPGVLDLTVSNPTAVGLLHPPDLYASLGDLDNAVYDPDPLGLPLARAAVADYYRARRPGLALDLPDIALLAGTSEAYAHLLAILCDPGDVVLVPQPGYPLLPMLADLAHVELRPYPLVYEGTWSIDLDALAAAVDPRTRAIVLVAPNNPTGNYLAADELAAIDALAAARGLAVIVDEVFFDYSLTSGPVPSVSPPSGPSRPPGHVPSTSPSIPSIDPEDVPRLPSVLRAEEHVPPDSPSAPPPSPPGHVPPDSHALTPPALVRHGHLPAASPIAGQRRALTFVLSGLSKVACLPQLKLAWAVARGPDELVREAMRRLELVADAYLSVGTPVQRAAPALLAAAPAMQALVRARARTNLDRLRRACIGTALDVLAVEAGWTALLRLPRVLDDGGRGWARELLHAGVLTQPGELYELSPAHLALSLITPEHDFAAGVDRITERVERVLASGPCTR